MLSEMNQRFSDDNLDIMQAIQSCNSQSSSFLDTEELLLIINAYTLNKDVLADSLARHTLQGKSISSVYEVFEELLPLKNVFPNLRKLLQIVLTIAVSSASCECSFSSLKCIETWLCTIMTEKRFVDLATILIERDLSAQLSLDEVITEFAATDRRIILS